MSDHTTRGEKHVELTPGFVVPARRAVEWFQGTRPLDDLEPSAIRPDDEGWEFFQSQVDGGLLTREAAVKLWRRHQQLKRIESGQAPCGTCAGTPPTGFTCQSCGTEGRAK